MFTAKVVGVGGVYVNEVECTVCKRVLAAVEGRLLPVHSMTTWHIRKTGDDQFHVHGGDQFTRIEEDVDGPKLMGMLTAKGLSTEQAMSVAYDLDSKGIGFHTTIAFRPVARALSHRLTSQTAVTPSQSSSRAFGLPTAGIVRWV